MKLFALCLAILILCGILGACQSVVNMNGGSIATQIKPTQSTKNTPTTHPYFQPTQTTDVSIPGATIPSTEIIQEYIVDGFDRCYSGDIPLSSYFLAYSAPSIIDENAEFFKVELHYGALDPYLDEVQMISIYAINQEAQKFVICELLPEVFHQPEYLISYQLDENGYLSNLQFNHSELIILPCSILSGDQGYVELCVSEVYESGQRGMGAGIRFEYEKKDGKYILRVEQL